MSLVTTQHGGRAALACTPSGTDSAMNRGRSAATASPDISPGPAAAPAVAAH